MSLYYPQGAITLRIRWESFGNDDPKLDEQYSMTILARTMTVEINDYTEADTFNCEFDYQSFPFDPRSIRSCGITIHMKDKKQVFDGNSPDRLVPEEKNIVFQGFVDEESISFDDSNRTVRMEGRDFTSLFLDVKRTNTNPLPLTKPINKLIESLIQEQKATEEILVDVRVDGELPTMSKLAPDFNPISATKNSKRNESYWDFMQDILAKAGLIGYIELDKFVISKPRALYGREKMKQFVYGKNVSSLEFTRKLGRQKNFNVKVVSLDMGTKKLLEVLIPEDAKDSEFVERFGNKRVTLEQLDKDGKKIEPPKGADFLTFRVPDIVDKDHLIVVGESIFEEISRQELEGSLTTFEMLIPEQIDQKNRQRTNPIAFNQIRVGTPIQLYIEQPDIEAIGTLKKLAEKRKYLIKQGFNEKIAAGLADSVNKIASPFYTKSVTYILSQDNGFQMDLKFINFIELDNSDMSI